MSGYDQHSLDRLTPSYLASFGLREAPFADAHDDRFFFLEPERAQRLNILQHMVQYSDLLLMVTGERGSGKTALMQRLLQNLSEQWQVCQIPANTMMDAEQLLFQIGRGFTVENLPQTSAELQEQLYQRLAGLHERDRIPLLVIDDAHELSQDALEMVFQLADVETAGGKLVRVILFCEPQIETMLDAPSISALRDRITHHMEMPGLSEEETAEYIKHRLAVSGFDGTSPFTPKMVKKIYKGSQGQPGKINMLAHELLEKGDVAVAETDDVVFEAEVRNAPVTKYLTPLRIVLGSAAIIIIGLVLFYQKDINRVFAGKVDQQILEANLPNPNKQSTTSSVDNRMAKTPAPDIAAPPVTSVKEKIIALQPDTMALDSMDKQAAPAVQKDPASYAVSTKQETPETAPQSSATNTTKTVAVTAEAADLMAASATPAEKLEIQGILPQPIIGSHQRQTVSILGSGFNKDTRVRLQWGRRNKLLSNAQVIFESPERLNIVITTGTEADDWKVNVVNGKQVSNSYTFSVLTPPRDTHSVADGQKWINQRPAAHFTLQLLSVSQLGAVERYIKKNHLDGNDIAIIKTLVKGQRHYVLIKGEYASREAAQAATRRLPAAVQKSRPWIRVFKDLQQQLKSTRAVVRQASSRPVAPRSAISLLKNDTIPAGLAEQTAWLWSQDPSNFTLQLFGTYQRDSIKQFIQQHRLAGKVAAFKSRRNGRDWYVLVYGSYPDRVRAKQAINRLPTSLSRAVPWVRSFASIHESLQDAAR